MLFRLDRDHRPFTCIICFSEAQSWDLNWTLCFPVDEARVGRGGLCEEVFMEHREGPGRTDPQAESCRRGDLPFLIAKDGPCHEREADTGRNTGF